jgi:hypothetical protein
MFLVVYTLNVKATKHVIAEQYAVYLGEQRLVRMLCALPPAWIRCRYAVVCTQAYAMLAESTILRAFSETDDEIASELAAHAREEVLHMVELERALFVGTSFPGFTGALDANDDEVTHSTV